MLAQPVAGTFDLDNHSVVQKSVQQSRRDDGIAEHLGMPQRLTGESLMYG